MHPAIAEAAACLRQAREQGRPCAPVRDLIERAAAEQDEPALKQAYAVQQHNNAADIAAGWNPVGHKIGLTSSVVQRQLGVDQPDFGRLFAQMARGDGQLISWSECQQPKVEAEIALVLERDLCNERHTLADIIRATAFALPAIEIVGSRIANWDISLLDTVADNASSGLFVLGSQPVSLGQLDLVNCGMRLTSRGEPVSVGAGAACLENPLNAAVWLANTMVRLGEPLRAGDVVLTGALGPMVPVSPGDVFTAEIQGLGRVTASFAQAE